MKERFIFIDILKGVAILLVVCGHIIPGVTILIPGYTGIFTMPLFFFVSGILFNNEKYKNNFIGFLQRRYQELLIPFFYFSIIVLLGYYFIEKDYLRFCLNILRNGWGGYALWFIPVLLLSQIIYYPFSRILSSKVRLVCLFVLAGCSYISSLLIGYIPYNLMLGFCGAYFWGMGNLFKPYLYYSKKINFKKAFGFFVLGVLFSFIYLVSDDRPEWFINKIPSIVYYIAPFGAILSLAMVALYIERIGWPLLVKFFSICGRQSYIILAFHQIICLIAQMYVPSKVAILIMIFSLAFLVWFIPKYMPWMLGKNRTENESN